MAALTEHQQHRIAKARQLAELDGIRDICEYTRISDDNTARANLLGQAQGFLGEMAGLAERLNADNSRLRNDRARYRAQLHLAPDADDQETAGYAPDGPLHTAPAGPYTTPADRRQAFLNALAGVDLGDYDQRIIDWLCNLDDPTCRTIISLIRRTSQATT
jgi:hypothetical protein